MLTPVFSQMTFFTLDGPSHVYNSFMLKEMLFSDSTIYHEYLQHNTKPEPNWLGHALLVLFMFLVDPLVAEKLLVAVYVILFLGGFRYLTTAFNRSSTWSPLLAPPMVYSVLVYHGFYNFSLGLTLILFTLGFWVRNRESIKLKNGLVLAALFTVGYFAHITTFLVTLGVIGATEFVGLFSNSSDWKTRFRNWGALIIAVLPMLVLTIVFIQSRAAGPVPENTVELGQQLQELTIIRPITVFYRFEQAQITKWLFIAIIAAFHLVLLLDVFSWGKTENGWTIGRKKWLGQTQLKQGLLLSALVMLAGYFVLPDQMASGGYVHMRLLLLFFIFILLWIGSSKTPNWLLIPLTIVSLVSTHYLLEGRETIRSEQNGMVHEIIEVEKHIPAGKTVFPIMDHQAWFFRHALNYLGIYKPMVILENYEADAGYFPLEWKMTHKPAGYTGFPFSSACAESIYKMEKGGIPVDIIVHHDNGTKEHGADCENTIRQLAEQEFNLIYTSRSGYTKVYERK
jgi:hypothetical protein